MEAALRLVAREVVVAIVGNETIAREGLTALLALQHDFSVVASVANIDAAELSDAEPDVILVEAEFKDKDGAQLARAVASACSRAKVVVTGVSPENCDLMALVRAGVAGFVVKNASLAELVVAIRSVASGAQVMPPALIEAVSRHAGFGRDLRRPATGPSVFDRMTPREHQIMVLIANGECNKDIARRTALSTHTVKSHVRNIMEKLGLHSRLQIAAEANAERWRAHDERFGRAESAMGGEASS